MSCDHLATWHHMVTVVSVGLETMQWIHERSPDKDVIHVSTTIEIDPEVITCTVRTDWRHLVEVKLHCLHINHKKQKKHKSIVWNSAETLKTFIWYWVWRQSASDKNIPKLDTQMQSAHLYCYLAIYWTFWKHLDILGFQDKIPCGFSATKTRLTDPWEYFEPN